MGKSWCDKFLKNYKKVVFNPNCYITLSYNIYIYFQCLIYENFNKWRLWKFYIKFARNYINCRIIKN